MGKIQDFENRLVANGGMTDDEFEEYKRLLKRVNDNFLKRQHCYTTAIQFSPENHEQAVKLINYGLNSFEDSWFSTYTSYLFIGKIYEAVYDFQKAYTAYLSAEKALTAERETYIIDLSFYMLWARLHIDDFKYSAEIEQYYLRCQKSVAFSKEFINKRFTTAVAKIIIDLHYNNKDEAKKSYAELLDMCDVNYKGKLYYILKRHRVNEAFKTTPQAIKFIKSLKL